MSPRRQALREGERGAGDHMRSPPGTGRQSTGYPPRLGCRTVTGACGCLVSPPVEPMRANAGCGGLGPLGLPACTGVAWQWASLEGSARGLKDRASFLGRVWPKRILRRLCTKAWHTAKIEDTLKRGRKLQKLL